MLKQQTKTIHEGKGKLAVSENKSRHYFYQYNEMILTAHNEVIRWEP